MGLLAGDEFRLLYAIGLNALVLLASWRFARRFSSDVIEAASDAALAVPYPNPMGLPRAAGV